MRLEAGRGNLRLEGVVNREAALGRVRLLHNFGAVGPFDFYGEAHAQGSRAWDTGAWDWEIGAGTGVSW